MAHYLWKDGFSAKISPEVFGLEMERLGALHGGRVTPEILVEAARDPNSPLHPLFTWDDTQAAENWRKTEARKYCAAIRIVMAKDNRPIKTIAWISVNDPVMGRGYQPAARVLTNRELTDRAFLEIQQALEGIRRRYVHCEEVQRLLSQLEQQLGAG